MLNSYFNKCQEFSDQWRGAGSRFLTEDRLFVGNQVGKQGGGKEGEEEGGRGGTGRERRGEACCLGWAGRVAEQVGNNYFILE